MILVELPSTNSSISPGATVATALAIFAAISGSGWEMYTENSSVSSTCAVVIMPRISAAEQSSLALLTTFSSTVSLRMMLT